MSLTVASPTVELITLPEARLQCSIDPDLTKWDPILAIAIKAARARAEHITGRFFAPRGAVLTLDGFPAGDFELRASPVASIDGIEYVDTSGGLQTVPSFGYLLGAGEPAAVLLAAGAAWPSTSGADSVRIAMTVGYAGRADVDARFADVTAWMLMQIATIFRQRELFAQGVTIADLPNGYADRMLDSARVWE